jgi:hypothetical protein
MKRFAWPTIAVVCVAVGTMAVMDRPGHKRNPITITAATTIWEGDAEVDTWAAPGNAATVAVPQNACMDDFYPGLDDDGHPVCRLDNFLDVCGYGNAGHLDKCKRVLGDI